MGKSVAFLHHWAKVGGAEHLVLSLAFALAEQNWDVTVCLGEKLGDTVVAWRDPRIKHLHVFGSRLPDTFLNRFWWVCTVLKSCWMVICLAWINKFKRYDLVIQDHVAASSLLTGLIAKKTVYYCHFPVQAGRPKNESSLYHSIYTPFVDAVEQYAVGLNSKVWLNSEFTASHFRKRLKYPESQLHVIYPCPRPGAGDPKLDQSRPVYPGKYFLSCNRFDRFKGIHIAIEAYVKYLTLVEHRIDSEDLRNTKLILIGGGSEGNPYIAELEKMISGLTKETQAKIEIHRNVSNETVDSALKHAVAVLYTPATEHFGIVPVEAMSKGTVVIAVNGGGPVETVVDKVTGSLVPQTPEAFAEAMLYWVERERYRTAYASCVKRGSEFSFEKFSHSILRQDL